MIGASAAGLVGGIGLFLIGMRLMTEGLKLAAGGALRDILGRWTDSVGRGILSGALLTGLVQSSSAVTVATIGFVNAGVLTLSQGLGVIYGSNVGTTATGWIVAAIGFDLDVKALALPLIGVGAATRLVRGSGRAAAVGDALAGFGLLFLGLGVLRAAFLGLEDQVDLAGFAGPGPLGAAVLVLVGVVVTFLVQSSSATIALALTAVGGGALSLTQGAALVIGANVGTTSTAALSVLGATPNARRVALGHGLFNLVTGAVAFAGLPAMLRGLVALGAAIGWAPTDATVLATFHTAFNLLGVVLVAPFTRRLVAFLDTRFREAEEDLARPRHLDRNVLETPALALRALALELARTAGIVRESLREASEGHPSAARIAARGSAVARLLEASAAFANELRRSALSHPVAQGLPAALRAAGYLDELADLAGELDRPESRTLAARLGLESRFRGVPRGGAGRRRRGPRSGPRGRRRGAREARHREALRGIEGGRAPPRGECADAIALRPLLRLVDHLRDLRLAANRARKTALCLRPLLGLEPESVRRTPRKPGRPGRAARLEGR
ncbi:MAG: Na/Pi symporter [Planctomycetota bacterium]